MFYEDKINKALDNNEMLNCIAGTGEYLIQSREETPVIEHDFSMLLSMFNLYNKAYPERMLKKKYEEALKVGLKCDKPVILLQVSKCLIEQIKEEQKDNFDFKLDNTKELLLEAREEIAKRKDDIITVLNFKTAPSLSNTIYDIVKNEIEELHNSNLLK